jgi:hypothetical protein
MKALVWLDEELGAKFDEVEIPADLADQAEEYRELLLDVLVATDDDDLSRSTSATRRSPPTTSGGPSARHLVVRVRAGPVRLGVQEQGRAAHARRRRRLPAVAARHPPGPRA